MSELEKLSTYPVLPLKNAVLFPGLLMPLSIGRPQTIAAIEAALSVEGKEVVVFSQRDASEETPTQDSLYGIGTRAVVRRMTKHLDGSLDVMVMGVERVALVKLETSATGNLEARVRQFNIPDEAGTEIEALERALLELAQKVVSLAQPEAAPDLTRMMSSSDDTLRMTFLMASMMNLPLDKEQKILEAMTRADAMRLLHGYLSHELEVLELRSKIQNDARSEMGKEQRDYMLRQQLRAIQNELGEKNPEKAEVDGLRERFAKTELPAEAKKEIERELERLERTPASSPDHHVLRTWLEFVLDLPWTATTPDSLDIPEARRILDEDHYEIKEVKERILEQLSVLKMNPNAKAPILCFVGPPGVGKTSLGQSIARALGRKFERMSLGGMHDEAELRGHRRTYIGAMAGRLMQAIRRAGSSNPVILLDEIDKVGRDYRGDPSHALLEVLDPEQNKTFRDNYLDLAFDLSKVMFITTANALDTIPRPLLDRMEILRLSGYSEEEKVEIAKRFLIPRQLKETGLTPEQLQFSEEALKKIVSGYTREAGLRRYERAIGKVARKVTLKFVEGRTELLTVQPEDLYELLGPEQISQEKMRKELPPGVATGLAWTEGGGEVLYIEASVLPDGKGLTLTGQLGEVMQESVRAAQSYLWAHSADFSIDPAMFKTHGLHVHVPAGAVPKDGPSAGVTMATALASIYTKLPVRKDTAMTGELTLSGLVLPIGGVKEKVLAARRAGINRVLLPAANEKDTIELPEHVRKEMTFIFAQRIEEVLREMIPSLAVAERVEKAAA